MKNRKRQAKAKAKSSIEQPLIRSWARKSALSLLNALSSVPIKKLPQPVGKK